MTRIKSCSHQIKHLAAERSPDNWFCVRCERCLHRGEYRTTLTKALIAFRGIEKDDDALEVVLPVQPDATDAEPAVLQGLPPDIHEKLAPEAQGEAPKHPQ